MATITALVDRVHAAATNLGMDLSPTDVAFIIASFLECLADDSSSGEASQPAAEKWLRDIADQVNSVRDE